MDYFYITYLALRVHLSYLLDGWIANASYVCGGRFFDKHHTTALLALKGWGLYHRDCSRHIEKTLAPRLVKIKSLCTFDNSYT